MYIELVNPKTVCLLQHDFMMARLDDPDLLIAGVEDNVSAK